VVFALKWIHIDLPPTHVDILKLSIRLNDEPPRENTNFLKPFVTNLQLFFVDYFLLDAFAAAFLPLAPAFCLAMMAFAPFFAAALALPFWNCFFAPSCDPIFDFPFPAGLLLRDLFRVGSDFPAAPIFPFPFPAGDLSMQVAICKFKSHNRN
jgi:hypothetical protein